MLHEDALVEKRGPLHLFQEERLLVASKWQEKHILHILYTASSIL